MLSSSRGSIEFRFVAMIVKIDRFHRFVSRVTRIARSRGQIDVARREKERERERPCVERCNDVINRFSKMIQSYARTRIGFTDTRQTCIWKCVSIHLETLLNAFVYQVGASISATRGKLSLETLHRVVQKIIHETSSDFLQPGICLRRRTADVCSAETSAKARETLKISCSIR